MAETHLINPSTGELDKVRSYADLEAWADALYLRLDTTNNPLTGDLQISKDDAQVDLYDPSGIGTHWYIRNNDGYLRLIKYNVGSPVEMFYFGLDGIFHLSGGLGFQADGANPYYCRDSDLKMYSPSDGRLDILFDDEFHIIRGGQNIFSTDGSTGTIFNTNHGVVDLQSQQFYFTGTSILYIDLTSTDPLIYTDSGTLDFGATHLYTTGNITAAGTLELSNQQIYDSGGAIDFNGNDLSTTGTITGDTIYSDLFTSGSNVTVSATDPTSNLTLSAGATSGNIIMSCGGDVQIGTLRLDSASITDTSGAISFDNENLTTTGIITGEQITSTDDMQASGKIRLILDGSVSDNYLSLGAGDDLKAWYDGSGGVFSNIDLTTANATGKLQFSANYTPTGAVASTTGNRFQSTIDLTGGSSTSTYTFISNNFVAGLEYPDLPSFPPPSISYTGTNFANTIHGNSTAGFRTGSGTLTGVNLTAAYTGSFITSVGGFNFFPILFDVDFTATCAASHQLSSLDLYSTYNAANSPNQFYGMRLFHEAIGGVTVGGAMTGFQCQLLTTSGQATLSDPVVNFRAVFSSTYESAFNTNIAAAGDPYIGFWAEDSGSWNLAGHDTYAFYSTLINDAKNFSFVSTGANGWMYDNVKWLFGTGKDVSIYFDNSDLIINSENITANDEVVIQNFDAVLIASADLYWTGDGSGILFGEIYAYDANTTITISASGIANKVQITAFDTNGESNGVTPDHTNDHLTIVKAGRYLINCAITAESVAGAGAQFGFAVYKNNGATLFQNLHAHKDMAGGGGETGSISLTGIVDLAASDTIEVWVWNETNTENIIIDDITLNVSMIGGT